VKYKSLLAALVTMSGYGHAETNAAARASSVGFSISPRSSSPEVGEAARAVMQRNQRALLDCYLHMPKRENTYGATVVVDVAADGGAKVSIDAAPPRSDVFESCLSRAIGAMKLERPGRAVVTLLFADGSATGSGWSTIGIGKMGTMTRRGSVDPGCGLGCGRGPTQPAPRATLSELSTEGVAGVDEDVLRKELEGRLTKISACVPPGLAGTITADFKLNYLGGLNDAWASGMNEPAVETCVADELRGLRTSATSDRGDVKVHVAFRFRGGGPAGAKRGPAHEK